MKTEIIVYRIYFLEPEKFYVGITQDLDEEINRLENKSNKSLIAKAIQKYDDWDIKVLHTCYSMEDANRLKQGEIKDYDSVAPNGYNSYSVEARKKMSEAQKKRWQDPEYRKKMRRPEVAEKRAASRMGLTIEDYRIQRKKKLDEKIEKLKLQIRNLEERVESQLRELEEKKAQLERMAQIISCKNCDF